MIKELSLSRIIQRNLGFKPGTQEFSFTFVNSVRYLIHAISATEFNRRLKLVTQSNKDLMSAKDFRLKLSNSGYAMLRVKLHVLDVVSNARTKGFSVLSSYKQFGIKKSDRTEFTEVYKDREVREQVRKFVNKHGGKYGLPALAEIMDTLTNVLKRLASRVRNTVYRKLRFILNSNNMDRMDLENELYAKMIQAYYWQIPSRRSEDHWIKNLARVIKNAAINLIEHWTYQKRARMYRDEEGSFKLMESSSNVTTTRTEDGEELVTEHEIDTESVRRMELQVVTKQLYDKFATTNRRSAIIKIFMGYYDADYTQWLKQNKYITRSSDNVIYQEMTMVKRFLVTTAKYFKIRKKQFMQLIERMQIALNNYSSEVYSDGYKLAA